jgi:hypothetical protein
MSGETFLIRVDEKGLTIDAQGFKGNACMDEFKKFLDRLRDYGITVDGEPETMLKSDAYVVEEGMKTGVHY